MNDRDRLRHEMHVRSTNFGANAAFGTIIECGELARELLRSNPAAKYGVC